MAVNRPSSSYSTAAEPLHIPRTPLESRQGLHPKTDDRLKWKTPPSRQLTRQKRVEYESDIRERFYDDYLGDRSVGDAGNEVLTTSELAKLKYDPSVYRLNAYQGLNYDPMRPVPAGVDLHAKLQQQKILEKKQGQRQRRMSDTSVGYKKDYPQYPQAGPAPSSQTRSGYVVLPPIRHQRPSSALHESIDQVVSQDAIPAVEGWLLNATKKDKEVAEDFFRTLSSHGQRPDHASKAALHRTRVRSAVMTPARKQRGAMDAQNAFQQMSREVAEKPVRSGRLGEEQAKRPLRRTNSDKGAVAKGSMFTTKKQMPSHYAVHPEWNSESVRHSQRK